jgi:NADH-quinone oxidoreductase subunit N
MLPTSLQTVALLAPELVLVAAALAAYLGGAFLGLRHGWLLALAGIAVAAAVAGQAAAGPAVGSGGVVVDGFATFIRWTTLGLGGLVALVQAGDLFTSAASRGPGHHRGGTCEEAGTFLVLLAGLSLTGLAGDLVLLFAGLELVSIPTYVLLGLKRTDARGQEASLKYFFLSLVASALFLYALVCLYGIGGSTNLQSIAARLRSADPASAATALTLLPVALGMAVVGAAFRLAAVPMHFYAPDVYEGTGPGNAALLSTLPKVAGIVVLGRLLGLGITADPAAAAGPAALGLLEPFWMLAVILAAVTMTVGNVMALWQRNLRRLLACSSIAHAGYLLVGIAAAAAAAATRAAPPAADGSAVPALAGTVALGGMTATLFYLATYALATIGVFGAIAYLGHRWPEWTGGGPRPPREEIAVVDDLDGLATTNPVAAFAIAVLLLSLAGIPPLPGFWGKLSLATAALEVDWSEPFVGGGRRAWFVGVALVLVVNAAIAAAYYLRIIAAIYFKPARQGVQADGGLAAGVAMLACLVLAVAVSIQPGRLFSAASRAGDALAGTLPIAVATGPRTISP